jgi:hypothetical protein
MQRLRAEIASDLQIFASRVEVLTSLPYFFRHAYAIDLDGTRLEDLRTCARAVLPLLSDDLKRFDEFLSDVGRERGGDEGIRPRLFRDHSLGVCVRGDPGGGRIAR